MAILEDTELYFAILEEAASYQYGVNSQIRIRALEEQFRVSAIPVRECLIRLSGEDFIDFLPGKGFFTKKPNVDYLRRQLEVIGTEFLKLSDLSSRNDDQSHRSNSSQFFTSAGGLIFNFSNISDFVRRARLNSVELARLVESEPQECATFHPLIRLFPYFLFCRNLPARRDRYFAICQSIAAKDYAGAQLNIQSYIQLECSLLPEACREIVYALLKTASLGQ